MKEWVLEGRGEVRERGKVGEEGKALMCEVKGRREKVRLSR